MIVGILIIVVLITIVLRNKKGGNEFELLCDLFEKSNIITIISSKLDDYIINNSYSKDKHYLIFSIIRLLTNNKRTELIIAMRQKFIDNDMPITIDIIQKEIDLINDIISIYHNNLNAKMDEVLQLNSRIDQIV